MIVLIPACGRGERFRTAGYDTVKPLISVYGVPMIDRVVSALSIDEAEDEYAVVINFETTLKHPTIRLDRSTVGATETALLALRETTFDVDGSLLLVDCDALYHSDILSEFRRLESCEQIEAAVLSFTEDVAKRGSQPKYSYVEIDDAKNVKQIAEKSWISSTANTGAYWFRSAREFMKLAECIMNDQAFQKGEAYVSCVLAEYLKRAKKVRAIVIEEGEYSNIGTPELLSRYLSTTGRAFLFDLDGTLVDTTDAYVLAWSSLLSCKGAYVDVNFFDTHISGLSDKQVHEKFQLEISSSQKDSAFMANISSVRTIPGACEFVRKCQKIGLVYIVTNSNGVAATALLKHIGLEDIPLLSADDVTFGKPNPEPYSKAMIRLGVAPKRCVVFEDSKGGVVSARAAGSGFVVAISNNLKDCDSFYKTYDNLEPQEVVEHLETVTHLSEELTQLLGQRSTVFPVRASGGYISEILSASSGVRKLVVKQENADHGVLQSVSEKLQLHEKECDFYASFASTTPVRTPACYGILPKSRAIVMEDLRKYDRAPDFTLQSGLKVVQSVACLHSHFKGASLGKLSTHSNYMKVHVRDHYERFRERWQSTLSDSVLSLFDHAAKYYEEAEAVLLAAPHTLLHGDLKFPNLFWDHSVNGGEPIFIDWQYAGPGQGIEDVIFLLVESCDSANFKVLADCLIHAYYDERQKLDEMEISQSIRSLQTSCALAGFPFFVAVWFGCIDASQLAEPNFPFLYIIRLANAFSHLYSPDWPRYNLSG